MSFEQNTAGPDIPLNTQITPIDLSTTNFDVTPEQPEGQGIEPPLLPSASAAGSGTGAAGVGAGSVTQYDGAIVQPGSFLDVLLKAHQGGGDMPFIDNEEVAGRIGGLVTFAMPEEDVVSPVIEGPQLHIPMGVTTYDYMDLMEKVMAPTGWEKAVDLLLFAPRAVGSFLEMGGAVMGGLVAAGLYGTLALSGDDTKVAGEFLADWMHGLEEFHKDYISAGRFYNPYNTSFKHHVTTYDFWVNTASMLGLTFVGGAFAKGVQAVIEGGAKAAAKVIAKQMAKEETEALVTKMAERAYAAFTSRAMARVSRGIVGTLNGAYFSMDIASRAYYATYATIYNEAIAAGEFVDRDKAISASMKVADKVFKSSLVISAVMELGMAGTLMRRMSTPVDEAYRVAYGRIKGEIGALMRSGKTVDEAIESLRAMQGELGALSKAEKRFVLAGFRPMLESLTVHQIPMGVMMVGQQFYSKTGTELGLKYYKKGADFTTAEMLGDLGGLFSYMGSEEGLGVFLGGAIGGLFMSLAHGFFPTYKLKMGEDGKVTYEVGEDGKPVRTIGFKNMLLERRLYLSNARQAIVETIARNFEAVRSQDPVDNFFANINHIATLAGYSEGLKPIKDFWTQVMELSPEEAKKRGFVDNYIEVADKMLKWIDTAEKKRFEAAQLFGADAVEHNVAQDYVYHTLMSEYAKELEGAAREEANRLISQHYKEAFGVKGDTFRKILRLVAINDVLNEETKPSEIEGEELPGTKLLKEEREKLIEELENELTPILEKEEETNPWAFIDRLMEKFVAEGGENAIKAIVRSRQAALYKKVASDSNWFREEYLKKGKDIVKERRMAQAYMQEMQNWILEAMRGEKKKSKEKKDVDGERAEEIKARNEKTDEEVQKDIEDRSKKNKEQKGEVKEEEEKTQGETKKEEEQERKVVGERLKEYEEREADPVDTLAEYLETRDTSVFGIRINEELARLREKYFGNGEQLSSKEYDFLSATVKWSIENLKDKDKASLHSEALDKLYEALRLLNGKSFSGGIEEFLSFWEFLYANKDVLGIEISNHKELFAEWMRNRLARKKIDNKGLSKHLIDMLIKDFLESPDEKITLSETTIESIRIMLSIKAAARGSETVAKYKSSDYQHSGVDLESVWEAAELDKIKMPVKISLSDYPNSLFIKGRYDERFNKESGKYEGHVSNDRMEAVDYIEDGDILTVSLVRLGNKEVLKVRRGNSDIGEIRNPGDALLYVFKSILGGIREKRVEELDAIGDRLFKVMVGEKSELTKVEIVLREMLEKITEEFKTSDAKEVLDKYADELKKSYKDVLASEEYKELFELSNIQGSKDFAYDVTDKQLVFLYNLFNEVRKVFSFYKEKVLEAEAQGKELLLRIEKSHKNFSVIPNRTKERVSLMEGLRYSLRNKTGKSVIGFVKKENSHYYVVMDGQKIEVTPENFARLEVFRRYMKTIDSGLANKKGVPTLEEALEASQSFPVIVLKEGGKNVLVPIDTPYLNQMYGALDTMHSIVDGMFFKKGLANQLKAWAKSDNVLQTLALFFRQFSYPAILTREGFQVAKNKNNFMGIWVKNYDEKDKDGWIEQRNSVRKMIVLVDKDELLLDKLSAMVSKEVRDEIGKSGFQKVGIEFSTGEKGKVNIKLVGYNEGGVVKIRDVFDAKEKALLSKAFLESYMSRRKISWSNSLLLKNKAGKFSPLLYFDKQGLKWGKSATNGIKRIFGAGKTKTIFDRISEYEAAFLYALTDKIKERGDAERNTIFATYKMTFSKGAYILRDKEAGKIEIVETTPLLRERLNNADFFRQVGREDLANTVEVFDRLLSNADPRLKRRYQALMHGVRQRFARIANYYAKVKELGFEEGKNSKEIAQSLVERKEGESAEEYLNRMKELWDSLEEIELEAKLTELPEDDPAVSFVYNIMFQMWHTMSKQEDLIINGKKVKRVLGPTIPKGEKKRKVVRIPEVEIPEEEAIPSDQVYSKTFVINKDPNAMVIELEDGSRIEWVHSVFEVRAEEGKVLDLSMLKGVNDLSRRIAMILSEADLSAEMGLPAEVAEAVSNIESEAVTIGIVVADVEGSLNNVVQVSARDLLTSGERRLREDIPDKIVITTDGSERSVRGAKHLGYGVVMEAGGKRYSLGRVDKKAVISGQILDELGLPKETSVGNNIVEIWAVYQALKRIPRGSVREAVIVTDSDTTLKILKAAADLVEDSDFSFEYYDSSWKRVDRNVEGVIKHRAMKALRLRLAELMKDRKIKVVKIPSHTTVEMSKEFEEKYGWNRLLAHADKLAKGEERVAPYSSQHVDNLFYERARRPDVFYLRKGDKIYKGEFLFRGHFNNVIEENIGRVLETFVKGLEREGGYEIGKLKIEYDENAEGISLIKEGDMEIIRIGREDTLKTVLRGDESRLSILRLFDAVIEKMSEENATLLNDNILNIISEVMNVDINVLHGSGIKARILPISDKLDVLSAETFEGVMGIVKAKGVSEEGLLDKFGREYKLLDGRYVQMFGEKVPKDILEVFEDVREGKGVERLGLAAIGKDGVVYVDKSALKGKKLTVKDIPFVVAEGMEGSPLYYELIRKAMGQFPSEFVNLEKNLKEKGYDDDAILKYFLGWYLYNKAQRVSDVNENEIRYILNQYIGSKFVAKLNKGVPVFVADLPTNMDAVDFIKLLQAGKVKIRMMNGYKPFRISSTGKVIAGGARLNELKADIATRLGEEMFVIEKEKELTGMTEGETRTMVVDNRRVFVTYVGRKTLVESDGERTVERNIYRYEVEVEQTDRIEDMQKEFENRRQRLVRHNKIKYKFWKKGEKGESFKVSKDFPEAYREVRDELIRRSRDLVGEEDVQNLKDLFERVKDKGYEQKQAFYEEVKNIVYRVAERHLDKLWGWFMKNRGSKQWVVGRNSIDQFMIEAINDLVMEAFVSERLNAGYDYYDIKEGFQRRGYTKPYFAQTSLKSRAVSWKGKGVIYLSLDKEEPLYNDVFRHIKHDTNVLISFNKSSDASKVFIDKIKHVLQNTNANKSAQIILSGTVFGLKEENRYKQRVENILKDLAAALGKDVKRVTFVVFGNDGVERLVYKIGRDLGFDVRIVLGPVKGNEGKTNTQVYVKNASGIEEVNLSTNEVLRRWGLKIKERRQKLGYVTTTGVSGEKKGKVVYSKTAFDKQKAGPKSQTLYATKKETPKAPFKPEQMTILVPKKAEFTIKSKEERGESTDSATPFNKYLTDLLGSFGEDVC